MLVVNQLRSRQTPTVFRQNDYVLAGDHVVGAAVVGPMTRGEYRVLCASGSEERGDDVLEFHACIVVEEVGRIDAEVVGQAKDVLEPRIGARAGEELADVAGRDGSVLSAGVDRGGDLFR